MNFESKLAWRYFRQRRKSLARFTSLAAIVGIAAGVASLILAQALARGFSDEMRDKILANTSHISIFRTDGAEIADWQTFKKNLEQKENIAEISATTYERAVLVGAQTTSYAVLRAVRSSEFGVRSLGFRVQSSEFRVQSQPESRTLNLEIQGAGENQKLENNIIEVSLGKELAAMTDLKPGDEAKIILIEDETAPKTFKVFVRDVFETGLYEYDATWIRLSPENFARLKERENFAPTVLNVATKDIYAAPKTANEIRRELGNDFKAVDWQEANQPLFAALGLERLVALAIISLIIFVSALNITTTLALLVNERRLDIAVLRTCGARIRSLVFVFLLEGALLGCLGIFFGVVLGLVGCFLGNYFELVSLSKEVYSLSYISLRPDAKNIALIIFIAFLLCLAATVYPAAKASRIKPLENLRRQ